MAKTVGHMTRKNVRVLRPRSPGRACGRAATIARRLLPSLVLAGYTAALAAAPPNAFRLRLLDGPTGAALAGSAVSIEVYVRQSGCSQDSCFGYRVDLHADDDGEVVLPSSSTEAAGRPITELLVSAAGHEEKHVGPKVLASAPPITLTLRRAPPDLADLHLRLVAAKTFAPLAGVPVHIEIAYQQVQCVVAPCVIPSSSVDLTADARGEVAFRPRDRVMAPTGYVSLTITAGHFPPLTVDAKELAVPQPVTLVMGRGRPSSSERRAPRALPAPRGRITAAIRTTDGHYLTIVNGGGLGYVKNAKSLCALYTDARVPGPRETFTVAWLDEAYTRFTLKTLSGNYVSAIDGGGVGGPTNGSSPVHTDASALGEWETLKLNFLPEGRLTIATPDGHFLSALNGGGILGQTCPVISTVATKPGSAETFTLEVIPQTGRKGAVNGRRP